MLIYCERIESIYLKFAKLVYEANAPLWEISNSAGTNAAVTAKVEFDDVKDYLVERIRLIVVDIVKKKFCGWDCYPKINFFGKPHSWDYKESDAVKSFISFSAALDNKVVDIACEMFLDVVLGELNALQNHVGDAVLISAENPFTLKLQLVQNSDDNFTLGVGTLDEALAEMEKHDECVLFRLLDGACCLKSDYKDYMFVNGEEPGEGEEFGVFLIQKE